MFMHVIVAYHYPIDTLRRLVNNNNESPKHEELIKESKPSPATSNHKKDKKFKPNLHKNDQEFTDSPSKSTESKGSENSTLNSVSPKSSSKSAVVRYFLVNCDVVSHGLWQVK